MDRPTLCAKRRVPSAFEQIGEADAAFFLEKLCDQGDLRGQWIWRRCSFQEDIRLHMACQIKLQDLSHRGQLCRCDIKDVAEKACLRIPYTRKYEAQLAHDLRHLSFGCTFLPDNREVLQASRIQLC